MLLGFFFLLLSTEFGEDAQLSGEDNVRCDDLSCEQAKIAFIFLFLKTSIFILSNGKTRTEISNNPIWHGHVHCQTIISIIMQKCSCYFTQFFCFFFKFSYIFFFTSRKVKHSFDSISITFFWFCLWTVNHSWDTFLWNAHATPQNRTSLFVHCFYCKWCTIHYILFFSFLIIFFSYILNALATIRNCRQNQLVFSSNTCPYRPILDTQPVAYHCASVFVN